METQLQDEQPEGENGKAPWTAPKYRWLDAGFAEGGPHPFGDGLNSS